MPIWLIKPLIALALLLAAYAGGRWHQYQHDFEAQVEEKLAASESVRLADRARTLKDSRIRDEQDAAYRTVADRLAAALQRVRERPDRLPEAARAACAGATGRELSNRDSEFLERLAARADGIRAALDACQQREAVEP